MAQELENITYQEEFILNPRGLKLFTCGWMPSNREPKALIFLCHGYGIECSISMRGTGVRLAKAGFAVHGIDYQGHGKSSGLQGYIPSFENLVNDCSDHFTSICEKKENKKKLRYLLGESMGGAVALLLHRKQPKYWDGAVLVAPMCKLFSEIMNCYQAGFELRSNEGKRKIAEEMRPHPLVINLLIQLCKVIPTWKVVPTQDIIDVAVKDPNAREEVRSNPYCYKGRPRLKTGAELLIASLDVEKNLDKVSLPFIVVHGGDDIVTDPSVSKLLYDTASSTDKTLKLYPGMWHALIGGETPENIELVFSDIISWLDERTNGGDLLRSAREMKAKHEDRFLNSHENKTTIKARD